MANNKQFFLFALAPKIIHKTQEGLYGFFFGIHHS